jgi:hypothetical protein
MEALMASQGGSFPELLQELFAFLQNHRGLSDSTFSPRWQHRGDVFFLQLARRGDCETLELHPGLVRDQLVERLLDFAAANQLVLRA